jgi:photosynthetic reaction center cytochrome c subunit
MLNNTPSGNLVDARRLSCFPIPGLLLSFALLCCVYSGWAQSVGKTAPRRETQSPAKRQREPAAEQRCVFCHPSEVEGYANSAMAHSLRSASQEPAGTVSANGTKITIHSSPTGYWQDWENAGDKSQYRVDYVVGSGNHASGYLVDIGGHLFQSPVAYYKSRQSYDLAPGYENVRDPDFTRPVSEECVLCHSGTALHIPGTLNEYRAPVFSAEGITCERCHGPVEKHLSDPRKGTIVNPAKLAPAARDSVCEQCHLFGAARVPNPGKKLSDFIPGQRLEDVYTTYHDAVPPGSTAGSFKVISHVEQLALSACARNSDGRLWCGTCHNPHKKPLQSLQYYRSRCLSCHTANFPASHPTKDTDCLACHMPRRDAKDGGHTAFTDHRIQRYPESKPELPSNTGIAAWREPLPDLQKRNLGIAYIDVGMQRHSSPFIIQGYRTLTEVQRQFTNDSDFFKWIGEALLLARQPADAQIAFDRALQLDPGSALNEANAAAPYIQEGNADKAIAHLEQAVTLDTLNLAAASTLINLYQKQGKVEQADELSAKMKAAFTQTSVTDLSSPAASASSSSKATEEVFKNIRVLKDIPADQLISAMQFMSSSLGVECSYCHVQDHFEKDDKKPKQTARNMMQMVASINKNSFEMQRAITCYSCHHGSIKPVATPTLDDQMQVGSRTTMSEVQEIPTGLLSATQLIDGYIKALGGIAAIEKVRTRVEKGTTNLRGQAASVEVFTQAPEKQAMVRHLPPGDSVVVFNGQSGWTRAPGLSTHEMHGVEIEIARMDADLHFPLHIQQIFPELRVEYPEKVGDREFYVLVAVRENLSVKLYFDKETGLLARSVRYVESPLGLNPSQVDYSQYREVDGVQIPFRLTLSQPGNSSTIQFEEVQQNIPIDADKFSKARADRSFANSAPRK